jgi:hypothetical protein
MSAACPVSGMKCRTATRNTATGWVKSDRSWVSGSARIFAGHLGVVPEVTTPVLLLTLAAAATVLLANLISIGPAVTAVRIRPASVLRQE